MIILNTPKIFFGIFFIFAIFIGLFLIYSPLNNDNTGRDILVERGDGAVKIARVLEENNLIFDHGLFVFYVLVSGNDKNLKAGKYELSSSMSIAQIVKRMVTGLSEGEDIEVTIPEGFNKWEIAKKIEKSGLATKKDILGATGDNEGFLFPDTYRFKKGSTSDEIIQKMKENFKIKISKAGLAPTIEQIIMASILEKEVRTLDDMALVSGILWKRLEAGMLLQVDATVAYGECMKNVGDFCDIALVPIRDSLGADTPYNSYLRKGLPVGPISNPGLAAITAAINPTRSDYWYYLSATAEDGRTIFSKTAGEHARNRAKYIK